ncbi:MAG TPA: hypothetical protein PL070_08775, partial [Flavobacteriales bacterium]|nr:hypothetical protein [Flavobacteriales bacterium]
MHADLCECQFVWGALGLEFCHRQMANEARQHRFSAAAKREGDNVTLILGGYIWPENENASAQIAQQLMLLQENDNLTVILRNFYGGDCDEG